MIKSLFFPRPHTLRINAKAPDHGLIFAPGVEIQINAEGALPEWIQLAPFGRHPTRDKLAVQVFNAESADQVISWFNFWPRKIARLANINAICVWVGHPDFAPEQWPERIELGKVLELNADEHGLNGRIGWHKDAMDYVSKHKFPSVAWDCEVNGDGTETPAMLWSVGMWHKPNIKTVQAVINACACEENEEPQTEEEPMLNSILTSLRNAGIVKEGDDENTVVASIGSMIQSLAWKREETARQEKVAGQIRTALNASVDTHEMPDEALPDLMVQRFNAAQTELADARAALELHRVERINGVITLGIETGRITKAESEDFRVQLNADLDKGTTAILERRVRLNSASLSLGGSKPAVVEAHERTTRLNAWIDSHMQEKGCDRHAAWEASKTDPAMQAIHAAMAAADTARAGAGGDA